MLSELLDLSLDELLVGRPTVRIPGNRGPASRLEQQLDAITRLPKVKQRVVAELIDSVRGGSVCLHSLARLLSGAPAGFMPLREAAG